MARFTAGCVFSISLFGNTVKLYFTIEENRQKIPPFLTTEEIGLTLEMVLYTANVLTFEDYRSSFPYPLFQFVFESSTCLLPVLPGKLCVPESERL